MLVPFVGPYSPPAESRGWYMDQLAGDQHGRSPEEVDRLIESANSALVQETAGDVEGGKKQKPKARKRGKTRTSAFDDIEKNLDDQSVPRLKHKKH